MKFAHIAALAHLLLVSSAITCASAGTGLPSSDIPLKLQSSRVLSNLRDKSSDLEKYIYLRGIAESNEDLYFATLVNNVEEGERRSRQIYMPFLRAFSARLTLRYPSSHADSLHTHGRPGLPEVLPYLYRSPLSVPLQRPLRQSR